MNLIYLIKTLNIIALIVIPLNYVYTVLGFNNVSGLIYIWLCTMGFFTNYCNKNKSKLLFLPIIASFLPLVTTKSIEELIYVFIYFLVIIIGVIRGLSVVRYDTELDIFRKGIYICIGTFIVTLMTGGISFFNSYSAYYVIIYLVTSILLLRNLRFIEYNKDSKEGKQINNRYSLILVIFSSMLSISYIRETVGRIIRGSYHYITEFFMYIFSWVFIGVGYVLSLLVNVIKALINKLGIKPQGLQGDISIGEIKPPEIDEGEVLIDKLIGNPIFKIIVNGFVILLVVYFIMRLFSSLMNKKNEQEEYLEEKEFMLKEEGQGKYPRRGLLDFFKPRNSKEQIRLYYQKYMKACKAKDIDITEKDTTEEINNKSQNKFDKTIIYGIRSIYIKVRYGEKEPTKEEVKEMGIYYNSIRKQ